MGNGQPGVVGQENYPSWTSWDFIRWWVVPAKLGGGRSYLERYKNGWVVYNRERIQAAARNARIPALLLAGVAWNEVGGKPDAMDSLAFPVRSFDWCGPDWVDRRLTVTKRPELTSMGAVSIQLRVAAQTLGLDISSMSFGERQRLQGALESNVFNLNVVAMHLYNLIKRDFPEADTINLTDEQFVVIGSRYNRGTARKKEDYIASINAAPGTPVREYSSYGRTMLRRRESIRILWSQRATPGR